MEELQQSAPVATPNVQNSKPTERERLLGALSYLGPLFVVSYLMAEESKFVKFHAGQGLMFFLAVLVLRYLVGGLLMVVFVPAAVVSYRTGMMGMMGYGGGVAGLLLLTIHFVIIVFAILGIVKAAQGERWEMPVIGPLAKKINV